MPVDEFLARHTSAQLSELMAYYKIEAEDYEYIKKDLDPELAREKLDAMEDELEEFELVEELERMEHAEFFRDIIHPGGKK